MLVSRHLNLAFAVLATTPSELAHLSVGAFAGAMCASVISACRVDEVSRFSQSLACRGRVLG